MPHRALHRLAPLAIVLAIAGVLQAQSQQSAVSLFVDAREAPRGIFHAQLAIPVQPGPTTLLYPQWIPGEHGPTGPVRDLVGLKFAASGKELAWKRDPLDMYAFHIDIPSGARSVDVSLDFLVPPGESGFTSGASVGPSLAVISWNQLVLYPNGRPASSLTYQARLQLPDGWKAGSALPVEREANSEITFRPVTLERLVDSPLIAGAHFRTVSLGEANNLSHQIDMVADEESQLEMTPEFESKLRRLIAETGALFGARHYGQYHFLLTLSDHVAHFGLEHHESSDNRVSADALGSDNGRNGVAGLLAHEFVHSWNGKYRRPAGLATADFSQPYDTDLLWVYEGLTEYLGTILTARSGLWSPETLRDDLASTAAFLDNRPGRSWRPLEDTAIAAQVLYDAPRAGDSWRRSASDFYMESTLIWLEADTIIRQRSQGRYSLDDFCRRFHGGQSGRPEVAPYSYTDVVTTLAELVPYDWQAFFRDRVQNTSAHAPLGGIEASGWRLAYRDNPGGSEGNNASNRRDVRYSLGMSLRDAGEISDVEPQSPAGKAGLAPGMKITAVNGRKYTAALLQDAVKAASGNSASIELLIEDRESFTTVQLDYHGGERYPYLERDQSKPDLLGDIIQSRAQ